MTGQQKAADLLGVSRSTLLHKIQPVMIELHEAFKAGEATADMHYEDAAIARWREFLSTLDNRGGRKKKLDYRALYKAWVEKEKQA